MDTFSIKKAFEILETCGREKYFQYCSSFAEGSEKNADALFGLGYYYHNADEPVRNLIKTEEYYKRAAIAGSEAGLLGVFILGCQYLHCDMPNTNLEFEGDLPNLDLDKAQDLFKFYDKFENAPFAEDIPKLLLLISDQYNQPNTRAKRKRRKAYDCCKYAADRQYVPAMIRLAEINSMDMVLGYSTLEQRFGNCCLDTSLFSVLVAMICWVHSWFDISVNIDEGSFVLVMFPFFLIVAKILQCAISGAYHGIYLSWAGWNVFLIIISSFIWLFSIGILAKLNSTTGSGIITSAIPELLYWLSTFLVFFIRGFARSILSGTVILVFPLCLFVLWNIDYRYFLLKKSTDSGQLQAIHELGLFQLHHDVSEPSMVEIMRQFSEAWPLIQMYLFGKVSWKKLQEQLKDIEEKAKPYYSLTAEELLIDAAEKGYTRSSIQLGDMHRSGIKVEKDLLKAYTYYLKAADAGDADGEYMIGYCYEKGIGVLHNLSIANDWYRRGREHGSVLAKERLNRPMRYNLLDLLLGRGYTLEPSKVELKFYEDQITVKDGQIEFYQQEIQRLNDEADALKQQNSAHLNSQLEQLKEEIIAAILAEGKSVKENLTLQMIQTRQELIAAYERSSENLDQIFAEYCEKAIANTQNTAKSNWEIYTTEETKLAQKFGPVWCRLQPDSCASLISARTLYQLVKDAPSGNFDYSGIAISASSALENELSKIFVNDYKKFLDDKKIPQSHWNDDLRKAVEKGSFCLGNLPYILETRNGYGCSTNLRDYLKTVLKEEKFSESKANQCFTSTWNHGKKQDFIEECENIRTNYRNPAAHAKTVTKDKAAACCASIMGSFEAAKQLDSTESTLMLLFDFLK